MYLHLGQVAVICTRDVIGIFDLDNTTVSKTTRDMLRTCEQKGEVTTIGYEIPKTFVVCSAGKTERRIYLSPVTPSTLTRRILRKR